MRALLWAVVVAGDALDAYTDGAIVGNNGYQLERRYAAAKKALTNYRSTH